MDQSSLGRREVHSSPVYDGSDIARVIDTTDFDRYGIIDVVYLDGSNPARVWVIGTVDREPVTGDMVLISYISGQKNAPYLYGFLEDCYMRNFVQIKKDLIRLQLPVQEIGVIDGISHRDSQEKLLDESYRVNRAILELTPEHFYIQLPGEAPGDPPAYFEMKRNGKVILQSRGTLSEGRGLWFDPES